MGNAPKMNLSPHPAGKLDKLTEWSTQLRHEANEGTSGMDAERVRGLGALSSMQSKKKIVTEKRRETHFLSYEDKEKWSEDYIETETAGARMRVQNAEAAIRLEYKDTEIAENAELMIREPEKQFLRW